MQISFSKKYLRFACFILFYFLSYISEPAWANMVSYPLSSAWYIGAGGGASWAHFANNTTVLNGMPVSPPYNQDLFSIQTLKDANVQLVAGYRWQNKTNFFPCSNIFFQYRSYINNDISGSIEQFSLPEFTNYNYRMKYSADLLTLNGKFDLIEYERVMPYVSGGAGIIINSLYDYSESPTANVTPRISPGYTTNNSTHMALTLGAGLDYILTENYWLTLGYEHVFQGSIKSGSGQSTWSNTSLHFGNVKMDTVFINFSMNLPTLS
ncbi:MAG: outer membrane beta-barrel protein [Gammaproteobacteria bacterium]|nr:outer membrane beta-barrel protein [Gammaproteobacteria bacterium]